MGEMWLERQAKAFRRLRCLEYMRVDRPTLLDRLRQDDVRDAYTARIHDGSVLRRGEYVHAMRDEGDAIVVARGISIVGVVRPESVESVSAVLALAEGIARFRIEDASARSFSFVLDEDGES